MTLYYDVRVNINQITVAGRLTRDPEVRYTQSGKAVTTIGLAINREWKDANGEKKKDATFLDVKWFGKTAETIGQYFRKGREIYVQGRLQLDTWDDATSGQKRSKLVVIGEHFQFVGAAPTEDAAPAPEPQAAAPLPPAPSGNGITDDDDSVPF